MELGWEVGCGSRPGEEGEKRGYNQGWIWPTFLGRAVFIEEVYRGSQNDGFSLLICLCPGTEFPMQVSSLSCKPSLSAS